MRPVIYPAPKALIQHIAAALQEPNTALIALTLPTAGTEK